MSIYRLHIVIILIHFTGSSGCNGDSGAGLVFPYPQGGELRWWLRGILSIGPRDGFSCRSNTYTAFTRVFALREWIKPQINEILSQREIYKGISLYNLFGFWISHYRCMYMYPESLLFRKIPSRKSSRKKQNLFREMIFYYSNF